ncbi:gamma-secretase subunit APH-1B [Puma concolor]|uniref:Gamma-secretase subunit APH-1 n=2 Tax=Felidae TaxID=9681 RepID=A0A6P6HGU0_PUMCO|nr:gamma-secretase subunit APH-1B [Puma concolor]
MGRLPSRSAHRTSLLGSATGLVIFRLDVCNLSQPVAQCRIFFSSKPVFTAPKRERHRRPDVSVGVVMVVSGAQGPRLTSPAVVKVLHHRCHFKHNRHLGKRAFFWLVSLLFSSLFWFMARTITDNKDGPIQKYLLILGVLVSVLVQEMFRFAYYKLLKKANEGLRSINPDETAPSMRLLAYVSGLGFGIMSGVFSFVNTLSDSLGPGTVGIHGDSPQFFLNSAFMTLVIILLHVFWGIIFFDGCEKKKWSALLVVLLTHLLVSALTFISPHYGINLVSTYIIVVLMGIWAFFVAGGSCRSLKLCLLCQDKDFLLFNQRSR